MAAIVIPSMQRLLTPADFSLAETSVALGPILRIYWVLDELFERGHFH